MTFSSLFDQPRRTVTPKLDSLDVPAEDIYNRSIWSTSPIKTNIIAKKKKKKRKETAFVPKWEDYDVMSNRWNYVRPMNIMLKDEKRVHIPKNATDQWIQPETLPFPVFGNVADASYFEKRVQTLPLPEDL